MSHELNHLVIIPDGNRRWAKSKNKTSFEGHLEGYKKFKDFLKWCLKKDIKMVSAWCFSSKNWKRTENEIKYLMDLFLRLLTKDIKFFVEENIKINIIGSQQGLSDKLVKAIATVTEQTKNNTKGTFNLLLNYGGRNEIVDAVKNIIKKGYKEEDITEELIQNNLYIPNLSYPDLIVRTSGEIRHSGCFLWQSEDSEYLFLEKHWPDIKESDVEFIVNNFSERERRFGGDSPSKK